MRLTYRKGGEETASHRVICPYAIVFTSGMWYAVAHCESSDGVRFFRLDRVDDVELLEARYTRPRGFSVEDVMADGKAFHAEGARTLRLRYSPAIARWIAEREGKTPAEDGSLVIDHPLADTDWAVRHVLQYGPDVPCSSPRTCGTRCGSGSRGSWASDARLRPPPARTSSTGSAANRGTLPARSPSHSRARSLALLGMTGGREGAEPRAS